MNWLDALLAGAGLLPGPVGAAAGFGSAARSLQQRKPEQAALDAIGGALSLVGLGALGRLGRGALKAAETGRGAIKAAETGRSVAKAAAAARSGKAGLVKLLQETEEIPGVRTAHYITRRGDVTAVYSPTEGLLELILLRAGKPQDKRALTQYVPDAIGASDLRAIMRDLVARNNAEYVMANRVTGANPRSLVFKEVGGSLKPKPPLGAAK